MQPKPSGGKGSKAALIVIVVLLLAALGAAGWLYTQNKSLKDDNNALKQQVSELSMEHEGTPGEEDADEPHTEDNQAAANVLATGQVMQESAGAQAVVDCMEQPGSLTEIWVRYGTDAASLKETAKATNELGLGDAGTMAAYSVIIPAGELTNGQAYHYQCAGTQDGKTVLAGMAMFNAKK